MPAPARRSACIAALALSVTLPLASPAFAAGFQIKETSASLQGMAYAGAAAGGSDISALYNNPATIGFHDGMNTAGGVAVILPSGEFSNVTASAVTGRPTVDPSGGTSASSEELAFVPSSYVSYGYNDKLSFGLGITAPYGLVTDYGRSWAGRYHGTRSELMNLNFNPVIAFKPTPKISIAVGGVVSYAKAELENAVDFQTIGAPVLGAGAAAASDGYAKVEGDDIAYGFTAGVIVRPTDRFRFGVGYRSEIDHDLEGDIDFNYNGNALNAGIAAGDPLGRLVDQAASASATLPMQVNIGASFDVTPQLTIAAEADWTEWSVFDELRIVGANGQTISLTEEKFEDSWFLSLGASYKVNDALTLKLGVAHDQGGATTEFRTPRLPDADRTWLSAGLSYNVNDHISLDLGYTYVNLDDVDLNLTATPLPTDPDSSRGNLSADGEADIHILTLGGTYKF